MINLGVVGAGRMGKIHADAATELPEAQVTGVYDLDPEVARKFAENYNASVYDSLAEMMADTKIQAVVNCVTTESHYPVMLEALANDKHVLCEKPMVRKMAEAEAILGHEKASERIQIAFPKRHKFESHKIKELIESGELGQIRMAKVGFCFPGYRRSYGESFADFDICGGVILDMMSHPFDLLNWFFGEAKYVSGASLMLDPTMPDPFDYVSGTIVYGNGAICNIDGSWQRQGKFYDRLEVYGDKATVICEQNQLTLCAGDEETLIPMKENAKGLVNQMSTFIDFVKNGTPPPVTVRDGYNAFVVANAMIEAAKEHKVVKLS